MVDPIPNKALQERIAALELELERDPDSSRFPELADALTRSRRFPEAEAVCHRGLAKDDTNSLGYLALGRSLFGQGKLPEATEALQRARALDGKNPEGYRLLGEVLLRRGIPSETLAILEQAKGVGISDRRLEVLAERASQLLDAQKTMVTPRDRGMGNVAIAGTIGGTQEHPMHALVSEEPEELFPSRRDPGPARAIALDAFPEVGGGSDPSGPVWGDIGKQWETHLDEQREERLFTDPEVPVGGARVTPTPLSDPLAEGMPPIPAETLELATDASRALANREDGVSEGGVGEDSTGPFPAMESPVHEAQSSTKDTLTDMARPEPASETADTSEMLLSGSAGSTREEGGDKPLADDAPASRVPHAVFSDAAGMDTFTESLGETQPLAQTGASDPTAELWPEKPRRGFKRLALLLVVLAVGTAVAGFFYWRHQQRQQLLADAVAQSWRAIANGSSRALADAHSQLSLLSRTEPALRIHVSPQLDLIEALQLLWFDVPQKRKSEARTVWVRVARHLASNALEKARKALSSTQSTATDSGFAYLLRAELAWLRGDLVAATAAASVAAKGRWMRGGVIMAAVALANGDSEAAKNHFGKVLMVVPEHQIAQAGTAALSSSSATRFLSTRANSPRARRWQALLRAEGRTLSPERERRLSRLQRLVVLRHAVERCDEKRAREMLAILKTSETDGVAAAMRGALLLRLGLPALVAGALAKAPTKQGMGPWRTEVLALLLSGQATAAQRTLARAGNKDPLLLAWVRGAVDPNVRSRQVKALAKLGGQGVAASLLLDGTGAGFAGKKPTLPSRDLLVPYVMSAHARLLMDKDPLRALGILHDVQGRCPGFALADRLRAALALRGGKYDVAAGAFLRLYRLGVATAPVLMGLAHAWAESGQLPRARAFVRGPAKGMLKSAEGWLVQGLLRLHAGQATGALRAARIGATFQGATGKLSPPPKGQGRANVEAFEEQVTRDGLSLLKARALFRTGKGAAARLVLASCAAPMCKLVLAESQMTSAKARQRRRAMSQLEVLLRERRLLAARALARIAYAQAVIHRAEDRPAEALAAATRATVSDAAWAPGHRLRGELLLGKGRHAAARRSLARAVGLDSKDADSWWLLARARRGDAKGQQRACRRFLALEKSGPRVRRARAMLRRLRR